MCDVSYASQVAADVAARYGVAVQPVVVQIVPQGASGIPLPVWDGHRLTIPGWQEKRQRMAGNRAREARRAGAASDGATVQLRDQVAALYAQGMTDSEMAAVLGKSCQAVGNQRRFLRLAAIRKFIPPPERPQDVRRRRVRELAAQGKTRDQIADLLGVLPRVVTSDAKALGLVLAVPERIKIIRPRYARKTAPAVVAKKRTHSNAAARQIANAVRMAAAEAKRAEVLRLLAENISPDEVAARVGVTRRHVFHIDQQARKARGDAGRRELIRRKIAELAAQGKSRREIRATLSISPSTVDRHMKAIGHGNGDGGGSDRSQRLSEIAGRLRALMAEGKTRAMMAADLGMTRKRVSIWLARIGVVQGDVAGDDCARGSAAQKQAERDALRAKVADMVKGGRSLAQIAAAVGRPAQSVRMLAHFAGVRLAEESEIGAATSRRAQIAELASQGKSRQEIICALGIDRHRLAYDLRILNLDLPRLKPGPVARKPEPKPRKGPKSSEKDRRLRRIRDMAAKGMSRDEMANDLGCSYERLSAYIKDAGVAVPRLCEFRSAPAERSVAAEARRDLVATLRNQGATLLMICTELSLPRSTVCADLTVLRRQGRILVTGRAQARKVRRATDHAADIFIMAGQGLTARQIAKRLAFSSGAVAAVMAAQPDMQGAA